MKTRKANTYIRSDLARQVYELKKQKLTAKEIAVRLGIRADYVPGLYTQYLNANQPDPGKLY